MAGREIFAKRDQLREFDRLPMETIGPAGLAGLDNDPSRYRITNEYQVTSEYAPRPVSTVRSTNNTIAGESSNSSDSSSNVKSYSVNITSDHRPSLPPKRISQSRRHKATLEASRAAFGYTKVAALFFVSLLVTWVPSSLNRVYSLIHDGSVSVEYAYAAGVVLSLMGFWNAVIYIATSHRACRTLFRQVLRRNHDSVSSRDIVELRSSRSGVRSDGDSLEGLAGHPEPV